MIAEQDTHSFVVFRIGSEQYALPIERVQSIIRYAEPTPVPRAPNTVLGIINLRGAVIPVIDLSQRLRGTRFALSATSRIVVAEGGGGTVGLAVDEANEVATVPTDDIKPPPESVLTEETTGAIEGVAERQGALIIILDLDEAVPKHEYASNVMEASQEGGRDA